MVFPEMTARQKKLGLLLVLLFIITPLGILTQSPAWGEWEKTYFHKILGFVPEGIQNSPHLVTPVLPDYQVFHGSPVLNQYFAAIIGVGCIFAFFGFIHWIQKRRHSQ